MLGALSIPNLWGAEFVHGSFGGGRASPYLACFLPPSPPRTLTRPLILDVYRTLINPTRTQLPTPTPNQNTSPKQTCPKPALKWRFRSLTALFPPHPPRPVHIVLARLPIPPPLSVCTWTRWYVVSRSYTARLGSTLILGERESWVRMRRENSV